MHTIVANIRTKLYDTATFKECTKRDYQNKYWHGHHKGEEKVEDPEEAGGNYGRMERDGKCSVLEDVECSKPKLYKFIL